MEEERVAMFEEMGRKALSTHRNWRSGDGGQ